MNLFSFFKKRDAQKFPSKKLQKIVDSVVTFFERSPFHSLPITDKFIGCGVYALFYKGELDFYKSLSIDFDSIPIYVGKAVPNGWRNGRESSNKEPINLWKRIQEHSQNISQAENLDLKDFQCKYVILDGDLIASSEAKLIRTYKPLWNCVIDGFGNHHPGKTRFDQAKPDWDVLHPGRPWAEEMSGKCATEKQLLLKIIKFGKQK